MLSRQDRLRIAPVREPGRRGDIMPELPDRPDLDQLRRQARELLRAATRDEPSAVARLRAVSERVTLSAAQLAVAREYGYRSWPALKAEVERRRLMTQPARKSPSPGGDEQGRQVCLENGGLSAGSPPSRPPRACCFLKRWSSAPVTRRCMHLLRRATACLPAGRPHWGPTPGPGRGKPGVAVRASRSRYDLRIAVLRLVRRRQGVGWLVGGSPAGEEPEGVGGG